MSLYSYITGATGIIVSSLAASKLIEHKMLTSDDEISKPPDTVSIIIPSLNEEAFIGRCLKSLRNQQIVNEYPDYFEYILADSGSIDNTVDIARPYVDKVLSVPKGKLTARNIATFYSKGNIVVSTDADTIYTNNWLNSLLKPFNNPSVVATVGSTIDHGIQYIPSSLYTLIATADRYIIHPFQMVGRNSAYYKHLFYLTGMFDTTINQQSIKQVLKEEEMDFGIRLSKYGTIKFILSASCIHLGSEKISCRMGLKSKNECDKYKISIERFNG